MNAADRRIAQVDGLRGAAILGVVAFHYFIGSVRPEPGSAGAYVLAPFRLAWTGVDLFFVLSGFLVGGICLRYRSAPGFIRSFLVRRMTRIVPLYFAVLAAFAGLEALAAAGVIGWPARLGLHAPYWMQFTFLQNSWQAAEPEVGGLAVTWSLAVEEQFYLLLPWFMLVCPRRLLVPACVLAIVLGPASAAVLSWDRWGLPNPGLLLPPNLDCLGAGVLLAVLLDRERVRDWLAARPALLTGWLAVGAIGFALLTLGRIPQVPFGGPVLATFYAAVLAHAVLLPRSPLARALRLPGLRWMGEVSYGVYLFHLPILFAVYGYLLGQPDAYPVIRDRWCLAGTVAALVLTLSAAALSWRYFERPIVEFGRRWSYTDPSRTTRPAAEPTTAVAAPQPVS